MSLQRCLTVIENSGMPIKGDSDRHTRQSITGHEWPYYSIDYALDSVTREADGGHPREAL